MGWSRTKMQSESREKKASLVIQGDLEGRIVVAFCGNVVHSGHFLCCVTSCGQDVSFTIIQAFLSRQKRQKCPSNRWANCWKGILKTSLQKWQRHITFACDSSANFVFWENNKACHPGGCLGSLSWSKPHMKRRDLALIQRKKWSSSSLSLMLTTMHVWRFGETGMSFMFQADHAISFCARPRVCVSISTHCLSSFAVRQWQRFQWLSMMTLAMSWWCGLHPVEQHFFSPFIATSPSSHHTLLTITNHLFRQCLFLFIKAFDCSICPTLQLCDSDKSDVLFEHLQRWEWCPFEQKHLHWGIGAKNCLLLLSLWWTDNSSACLSISTWEQTASFQSKWPKWHDPLWQQQQCACDVWHQVSFAVVTQAWWHVHSCLQGKWHSGVLLTSVKHQRNKASGAAPQLLHWKKHFIQETWMLDADQNCNICGSEVQVVWCHVCQWDLHFEPPIFCWKVQRANSHPSSWIWRRALGETHLKNGTELVLWNGVVLQPLRSELDKNCRPAVGHKNCKRQSRIQTRVWKGNHLKNKWRQAWTICLTSHVMTFCHNERFSIEIMCVLWMVIDFTNLAPQNKRHMHKQMCNMMIQGGGQTCDHGSTWDAPQICTCWRKSMWGAMGTKHPCIFVPQWAEGRHACWEKAREMKRNKRSRGRKREWEAKSFHSASTWCCPSTCLKNSLLHHAWAWIENHPKSEGFAATNHDGWAQAHMTGPSNFAPIFSPDPSHEIAPLSCQHADTHTTFLTWISQPQRCRNFSQCPFMSPCLFSEVPWFVACAMMITTLCLHVRSKWTKMFEVRMHCQHTGWVLAIEKNERKGCKARHVQRDKSSFWTKLSHFLGTVSSHWPLETFCCVSAWIGQCFWKSQKAKQVASSFCFQHHLIISLTSLFSFQLELTSWRQTRHVGNVCMWEVTDFCNEWNHACSCPHHGERSREGDMSTWDDMEKGVIPQGVTQQRSWLWAWKAFFMVLLAHVWFWHVMSSRLQNCHHNQLSTSTLNCLFNGIASKCVCRLSLSGLASTAKRTLHIHSPQMFFSSDLAINVVQSFFNVIHTSSTPEQEVTSSSCTFDMALHWWSGQKHTCACQFRDWWCWVFVLHSPFTKNKQVTEHHTFVKNRHSLHGSSWCWPVSFKLTWMRTKACAPRSRSWDVTQCDNSIVNTVFTLGSTQFETGQWNSVTGCYLLSWS